MPNFKVLKSEKRHAGKVFDLVVDDIEYSSGNRSVREVAEHPGGAVAVPLFDDGTLLMIRQYRYPIKSVIYELPAGKLGPGEDPVQCAKRELEEETGFAAGTMTKLTSIYTTPGFCTELLHLYLATDLSKVPGGQRLEEGEDLSLERIDLREAVRMIQDGRIVDGKTICGILMTEKKMADGGKQ